MDSSGVAVHENPTAIPVYDPYDYRLHEDPYPTYARLREHEPLFRSESCDFWALSRYADVSAALRDPGLYSSRNGIALEPDVWGSDAARTSSFLAMDDRTTRRCAGSWPRCSSPGGSRAWNR